MKTALLIMLPIFMLGCASNPGPQNLPADMSEAPLNRLLFMAVLEGLMTQGFPDALLSVVLEQDTNRHYVNFTYGCRVCTPSIEAFKAYSARKDFYYGRRGEPNFHYVRVPKRFLDGLQSEKRKHRSQALQGLISHYFESRVELMRLTQQEKDTWLQRLEELPKCPACEGSFEFFRAEEE